MYQYFAKFLEIVKVYEALSTIFLTSTSVYREDPVRFRKSAWGLKK